MNYYYDLTLNFKTNNLYKFYEWELSDGLIEIKKIPIKRVDEKTFINISKYKGVVSDNFLLTIKNKTTYKKGSRINIIKYACIITDTKFCLALLFNKKGEIISRSNLLLEDELNVIEIACSVKKEHLSFIKQEEIIETNYLRQEINMIEKIKKELSKALEENDKNKLKYFYLEWFNKENNNIKQIYQEMMNELDKDNPFNLNKIYQLILLTVNN